VTDGQPVLVVISEDPRASHRQQAMRIALRRRRGERGAVVLAGHAVHLLDEDTDDLVDGDDIAKFRTSLKKLGIPFHVEASAVPTEPDWNTEGHRVIPVTPEAIATLARGARRYLVF
jgi:hypothetical protein